MAGKERTLESTSTWAVAVVCFVLLLISIIIEQLIHCTGSWLKKKRKPSLYEALEKIKSELMLLGFISLLLTVGQDTLSEICVPKSVGHSWHPCRKHEEGDEEFDDPCIKKGKVQMVSSYGIHQLHIFIFALAVAHVLYCVVTYGLGKLKMRKWKSWEEETKTIEYQYDNDPERFRFARDTPFGQRHMHFWSKSPILLWIVCFFRQFLTSVAKVDYLTLRHGFITAHLTPGRQVSFNFHKYINKALEEDFKVVAGISPVIWFCAVLILLTHTNGWNSQYWLPFIPLVIILLVGAKLQVIITKMGSKILERGEVIRGTPLVQLGDDLFWFNRPGFILFLINLVLFQNAFQLAFFFWSWYEFKYPSCFHENIQEVIIRVAMGILIQFLCSYVTLPLYALVTQMGSNMKPVIFNNQVASALRRWHQTTKQHMNQGTTSTSTTPFSSQSSSPLHGSMSPAHLLRSYKPYNINSVKGGYLQQTSRLNNDDEGTSAFPHNQDANDFTKNGEIEREFEDLPESSSGVQHEVHINLNDISFRIMGNIVEGSTEQFKVNNEGQSFVP